MKTGIALCLYLLFIPSACALLHPWIKHETLPTIPDFSTARRPSAADRPLLAPFAIEPKLLFCHQLLPDTLPPQTPVLIHHYWRCPSQLLYLGATRTIAHSRRTLRITLSGEHWFLVNCSFQTALLRYTVDEFDPRLSELKPFPWNPPRSPLAAQAPLSH